jgi:ribosome production factor 2
MLPIRAVKPKTARTKRYLDNKGPQIVENPRTTLFLRYTSCSQIVQLVTQDLLTLKKPLCIRFDKKNTVHPFEDASSFEFFADKNDASMLVYGSHSKKRPHAVTIARMFDFKVLDMLELLVDPDTLRTLSQFKGSKVASGLKPLLAFSGSAFESPVPNAYTLAKSMFVDLFKGADAQAVDVEGLQYIMNFSVDEEESGEVKPKIHMRCYLLSTKKVPNSSLPKVEVEEMGPRIDFRVGRVHEADPAMLKEAMRRPKMLEVCCLSLLLPTIAFVLTIYFTAQDKEEHRNRPHGRQGWPHPHGQARPQPAADPQDEGSQAQSRRGGRRLR